MASNKKSVFSTEKQLTDIDSKLVVSLEKMSEVFRVLLWDKAKEHGLSPIQTQFIIFIDTHEQELCKVNYLAQEFNMTKATVSESVKTLLKKNLIAKELDPNDARSSSISLTNKGKVLAEQLSDFVSPLYKLVSDIDDQQKLILQKTILELIYQLNKQQLIQTARMCYTCKHYAGDRKSIHFCKLLNLQLSESTLRIDCDEHVTKAS